MKIKIEKLDPVGMLIDKMELNPTIVDDAPDTRQPQVFDGIIQYPARRYRYVLTIGKFSYLLKENGHIEPLTEEKKTPPRKLKLTHEPLFAVKIISDDASLPKGSKLDVNKILKKYFVGTHTSMNGTYTYKVKKTDCEFWDYQKEFPPEE